MEIQNMIGEIVLATGAVGTAAMGITEGFKSIWLPPIGFWKLKEELSWAKEALIIAYGNNYEDTLSSMFRSARGSGELPKVLRQGIRIGLNEKTAKEMAKTIGVTDPNTLGSVAKEVTEGTDISKDATKRNLLGRFEMAADARVDAALAMADRAYKNGLRMRSFAVALTLSVVAAFFLYVPDKPGAVFFTSQIFGLSLIIGLTAVPIAPIAKDVAKGFQAAAKALGAK